MSAGPGLSPHTDSSIQTGLTLQDLSLGSLPSFSTPAKYRVPSTASGTTALTPSPGTNLLRRKTEDSISALNRRTTFSKATNDDDDDDAEVDVLDTPNRDGAIETPMLNRTSSKRKSAPGAKGTSNLTLRDQEKVCPCPALGSSLSDLSFSISIR